MNKEIIEWVLCILVIIMIPIGIYSYIKIGESKKENCIAKGGYVAEDYWGFYNHCIVKEEE